MLLHTMRIWRNWQTRQLEGLVGEIPWGFDPPYSHKLNAPLVELVGTQHLGCCLVRGVSSSLTGGTIIMTYGVKVAREILVLLV